MSKKISYQYQKLHQNYPKHPYRCRYRYWTNYSYRNWYQFLYQTFSSDSDQNLNRYYSNNFSIFIFSFCISVYFLWKSLCESSIICYSSLNMTEYSSCQIVFHVWFLSGTRLAQYGQNGLDGTLLFAEDSKTFHLWLNTFFDVFWLGYWITSDIPF